MQNNNNNGAGLKRVSTPAVNKFARPNLPPLQSVTLGSGGDGFMHTPFTPVSTEVTPTPKAGNLTLSPTSPFSRSRLKPTFPSTSVGSININTSRYRQNSYYFIINLKIFVNFSRCSVSYVLNLCFWNVTV